MMQATHNPQDAGWIQSRLACLPFQHHAAIQREYANLYQTAGQHDGEKRRNANLYLMDLADHAPQNVFTLSDEEIRRKADRLALECRKLFRLARDPAQAVTTGMGFYEAAGFDPQSMAIYDAPGIIGRLSDAEFWKRKLTRRQDRQQEAFAIHLGVVRRGRGLYVSESLFMTMQARIQSSIRALSALEAINEDTGETVDMLQVLKSGVSNPEVRRVELMVRMRGFEDAATKAGHVGMFYTLTCPSKFHRYTAGSDTNPKYTGATPREAQAYLTALWARMRSKFKRDSLTAYGFRVAEPHHDACPHWHMLLFVDPAQREAVTAIIQHYALLEDGDERGAEKYRFKAVEIDASKGSATGYIAKYVSKNINGYAVDEDFEGGVDSADSSQRVRAWASLWGIRQFQQIGGAPVGVWRELRRVRDTLPDGLLEAARQAADTGDWCAYLELQGGVLALRKDQPLKVYTVERINEDTGEIISNQYGEIVAKTDGVELLAGIQQIKTRLHVWRIQAKAGATAPENAFNAAVEYVEGFNILTPSPSSSSSSSAPWSPVNNCTQTDEREVWG
ncbi:replication endonuclease [Thiothrix lacustris]|uniref:replication endonuclease n=1 Tax=Thiothrix lacustris TaxID=525917 RepID=UPI0006856457|nr:replication endonuclease [Thiothrix lacustris]